MPDQQHTSATTDGGRWPFEVRLALASDQAAVLDLYERGRLEGQGEGDDPTDDIRDIAAHYLREDPEAGDLARLWVAESATEGIAGMVAVVVREDHVAEMRRLRVAPEHRGKHVGSDLVEVALGHCRDNGCLKVILDTRVERTAAIHLFEKLGFRLDRTRVSPEGKEHLEFYMDLYRDPGG